MNSGNLEVPMQTKRTLILWGVAVFCLRLWACIFLGKILAFGWPETSPQGFEGNIGYIKIATGLFVMIFLSYTHTWSMLSGRRFYRFLWVSCICDFTPSFLGVVWGYYLVSGVTH